MRVISVNLNGIRSAWRKGLLPWLAHQNADIVCVQELKAQAADMTSEMLAPSGYHGYFQYAVKKGYSGVGIYCRQKPHAVMEGLGIPEFDSEGRYIEARFGNLSVVSLYLPSGSSGEERQEVKFKFMAAFMPHLRELHASGREILICGDWNVAHTEKDLKNWRGNRKNSGCLPEERAWLTELFNEVGFVDVFRRLHPELEAYTWWSNRGQAWAKNVGWRIDYHIATSSVAQSARATSIYMDQRFSDHAPLTVDYDINIQGAPVSSSILE
ncbi:exodeoxyribonuclease III [Candidatus Nitrotoga sp. M5]|uniref:exodeoxyribonuclease III n=1 Tax=Candidatus Nitrotoga sp. M5 TaxID=2890409 RepID=UPI001EF2278F|nr:exodeoxyribonuclease III [Candidatus Nitrotoga sp. M5]CAH1385673.1 Exodeoxyribonuclease [Candidatus Nitrotoga sp. M5]